MNMNEELEALAQRASEVYEAEQRSFRARQAAQAAEEEAERRQAERQAQERFEQALTLLECSGLPSVTRPWMRRLPTYPDSLTIQLRLPEPFGCSQCDWKITLRDEGWYGIAGCERINAAAARSGWLPPESFVRWLLFGLEASRREHVRWQALKAEDEVARAELAERQAEVLARACPWPKEATVTLYQVHYVRGMVATEEGELRWLEETGWSRSDQPDAEGYLTLEPTADGAERRILKLDPELHRPVFQKRVFSLTTPNDLPWELTAWQEEQISGFRWQQAHGRSWLVRDPAGSISISFRVPLPWVFNPTTG
ncbi:MAG: hypothetical protein IRZ24_13665 [Thermogemmatispora sp.]|uniref:hypothetical protein n=1 Tax=Thermogemmatispora sp. TaxID=1968838 RepID=UPI001D24C2A8|nr:hypothetical protein [Thermogemmatispora sp.]MBX5451111.1 hypothetical protein [Thermogemmatispora sp.]